MQVNSCAAQKGINAECSLWPPWLLRSNRLWSGSPESPAPVKSAGTHLASFATGLQVANSPSVLLELNLVSAGRGTWELGGRVCSHSLRCCVSLGPGALGS